MSARLRRVGHALLLAAMLAAGPGFAVCPPRAHAQSLYWIDTNFGAPKLGRADLDGLSASTVSLPPGTLPEGLAEDANGRLYFTESAWTNARVSRVVFGPQTSYPTPIVTGGSSLHGIAVNAATGFVYWTSSQLVTGPAIWRATLTGGSPAPLVALPPGANPRGIAIDSANGKLYWADFGLDAIYRSNLDGTGLAVWQSLGAGAGPWGVAFTPVAGRVFWTEYGNGAIRCADVSGGGILAVLGSLTNPAYLALDHINSRMYWTEGKGILQRLKRASTSGTGSTSLPPALATFGGLVVDPGPTTVATPPSAMPVEFALRLWPTPAAGRVTFAFELPRAADVSVRLYDLQGREVVRLAAGMLPAGRHERGWNREWNGRLAPAGLYLVRMEVEGRSWTRRLVLTP